MLRPNAPSTLVNLPSAEASSLSYIPEAGVNQGWLLACCEITEKGHAAVTYLVIMAHCRSTSRCVELEVVHSLGQIKRVFESFGEIVTDNLSPHMGLSPMYPGAAHLERIAVDIGRP